MNGKKQHPLEPFCLETPLFNRLLLGQRQSPCFIFSGSSGLATLGFCSTRVRSFKLISFAAPRSLMISVSLGACFKHIIGHVWCLSLRSSAGPMAGASCHSGEHEQCCRLPPSKPDHNPEGARQSQTDQMQALWPNDKAQRNNAGYEPPLILHLFRNALNTSQTSL